MAISTSGVTLKIKGTDNTYSKLVDIVDFPDLGATPELLETTTLSDSAQNYISGIEPVAALEFTANYSKTDFEAIAAKAHASQTYQLQFGTDGADGIFQFNGTHTVWVVGAGLNSVVQMKVSIVPTTKVSKVTA